MKKTCNPPYMMIKNLIFDFGKVLVDYDFNRILDPLFDTEEGREEFMYLIARPDFLDRCDKEDIPIKEIIAEVRRDNPSFDRELQYFIDNYPNLVTGEIKGMRELLLELKAMGYRLYGLTNWCSIVYEIIRRHDILQLLDGCVVSSDVHIIKPDTAIYEHLCSKFGLNAEECLFTDDKAVNVEGAIAAGWNAFQFFDAEQYRNELKKYGINL